LKRLEEILGFSISFNVVEHEKPFYQIVQLH
jgi:DNA relaxase NicK